MTETISTGKPVRKQLKDLKEFPGNPKQHDIAAIRASVRRHGQYRPVVITSDDVILAGNGTKKALYDEGYEELDCFQLEIPSTDENALRIVLGDNRISELGGYDDKALAEMLEQLSGTDDLLVATGYDMDAYEDLLAKMDAIPEPELGEFQGGYVAGATEVLPEPPADPTEGSDQVRDVRQIVVTVTAEQHRQLATNIKTLRDAWREESSSAVILKSVAAMAAALETGRD